MPALCRRHHEPLADELSQADDDVRAKARPSPAIDRLDTTPGVGDLAVAAISAWEGEIRRFPDAKSLAT